MPRASTLELLKFDEDIRQLIKTGCPVKGRSRTKGLKVNISPFEVEHLIGIDVVGKHSLVGPLVASAATVRRIDWNCGVQTELDRLTHTKSIESGTRNQLAEVLIQHTTWGTGEATLAEIDQLGLTSASELAMARAVQSLLAKISLTDHKLALCIVNGDKTIDKLQLTQMSIVDADQHSACVAAASVIAKVHRDNIMKKLARSQPGFDWDNNKGYLSQAHIQALSKYGRTPLHRAGSLQSLNVIPHLKEPLIAI